MTQGSPQGGQPLGAARGEIIIDISSVERAAQRVIQLSQQMSVSLAGVGKGSAAGIQTAMQQAARAHQAAMTQMLKAQAQAASETLQSVKSASQQVAVVIENTAVRAANAIKDLQNVQDSAARRRSPSGGRPSGGGGFGQGNPNIPTFAQFGLFPFAGLAGSLGASGLQQGILGASSLLGIAEIGSTRNAIVRLADQLKGLDGIFGSLASRGAEAAQRLGASAGGLVSSVGAIVGAAAPLIALIGGLALLGTALDNFNNKVQQTADKIAERADELAGGQTSEDIRADIRENEGRRQARQDAADEIMDILAEEARTRPTGFVTAESERARLAPLNQRLARVTEGEFTDLGDFGQQVGVRAVLGTLQGEIDEFTVAIAADEAALNSAAVRANDYAVIVDKIAKAQLDAAEAAEGLTNQEIDTLIQDMNGQINNLFGIINSGLPISEEYSTELLTQANNLQLQITALEGLKSPFRDFQLNLAQLPEALAKTGKAIADLRAEFDRETGRIDEDRQRAAEREEDEFLRNRQRRLEDFQREQETSDADYARDRARRIEDFEREQAELEAEAVEARADALEEFNREERRREEDHQIQMARTVRDGRISQLEAAARLDARALFETQRRTRIQLSDQQEDFERERARRLEDFDLQNEDLEENLEEQRRKRREDFERQLADQDRQFALQRQRRIEDFIRQQQQEEADRALRLRRQAEDYALQDQRRVEDLNARIQDQLEANTALQDVVQGGLNTIQFIWQYAMNGLVATTQNAAQQVAGAGSGGGTIGIGGGSGIGGPVLTPYFHSGTSNVGRTGLAVLRAGEVVLDPTVGSLYRRMLGNNFSQADAARAIGGRGRSAGNVSFSVGNVTIQGGVGDRSDADVRGLLKNAFSEWWGEELMSFMTETASDLETVND